MSEKAIALAGLVWVAVVLAAYLWQFRELARPLLAMVGP